MSATRLRCSVCLTCVNSSNPTPREVKTREKESFPRPRSQQEGKRGSEPEESAQWPLRCVCQLVTKPPKLF